MKKILISFLSLLVIFAFAACTKTENIYDSVKETAENDSYSHTEKADEDETSVNLNYKVIEKTTEETSKTNSESKTTEKTTQVKSNNDYPYYDVNDGDDTTYAWPDEGLAAEIPELKSGKMKKPYLSDEIFSVYFANVDPDGFDEYLETLKKAGFSVSSDTEGFVYEATSDKIYIEFFYDTTPFGQNTLSFIARYI